MKSFFITATVLGSVLLGVSPARADQVIGYRQGEQCMVQISENLERFGHKVYAVMLSDKGVRYEVYVGCR